MLVSLPQGELMLGRAAVRVKELTREGLVLVQELLRKICSA